MAIAASLVFVICLVLLGRIDVSLLVFLMVVLVDVEVLGCYYFSGMSFEFLTSIILVLAIGFSVDYSAHIAHAYVHYEGGGDGNARVRHAYKAIGRSVLCGGFVFLFSCSSAFLGPSSPKTRTHARHARTHAPPCCALTHAHKHVTHARTARPAARSYTRAFEFCAPRTVWNTYCWWFPIPCRML